MPAPLGLPPLTGKRNAMVRQKIPGGFLRLSYDPDGDIDNICAARTAGGRAVGLQLYFLGDGDHITCKTESGLSGQSFVNGVVTWGRCTTTTGRRIPGARSRRRRGWPNVWRR